MSLEDAATDGAFADEAPLMALFDAPAKTRILSVFVAEREYDFSKAELARQAGIARSTVYDHLADLLELGVVERSRATGEGYSERYRLAADDEVAEYLWKLEGATLERQLALVADEEE